MSRHDPIHDHKVLTHVHWAMIAIAAVLGATLVGALGGSTPDDACQAIGAAGLAATVAALWYAATNLTDRNDAGPLAAWSRPIRAMAGVNAMVSVAVVALPYVG